MKVKVKKCIFCKEKTKFLSHIIFNKSIKSNLNKVKIIKKAKKPKNLKEIQQFLGLLNYYNKFIRNFS